MFATVHILLCWFAAIYLTAIMCTCCASIILEMAVLNIYHMQPLRQIPRWVRCIETWCTCLVSAVPDHTARPDSSADDRRGPVIALEDAGQSPQKRLYEKNGGRGRRSELEDGIRRGIQVITDKIASNEKEESLRRQWMRVARLFDRLLFIIFSLLHFVIILIIFCNFKMLWCS